jgi:hypothetical protein
MKSILCNRMMIGAMMLGVTAFAATPIDHHLANCINSVLRLEAGSISTTSCWIATRGVSTYRTGPKCSW